MWGNYSCDWCFPLLSFLLTPFSGTGRGIPAQNTFNAALKASLASVEAIGLLKGRWRILQDLNVGLHHALQTIVACCVLHNLCQIAREPELGLFKEPEENGSLNRALESERSFYYYELKKLFPNKNINKVIETSLSANQERAEMEKKKLVWKVEDSSEEETKVMRGGLVDPVELVVELAPMEIRTFLVDLEYIKNSVFNNSTLGKVRN
ncbi:hypothetical protein SOVF_031180 [Spinacia oleracea]|nr:hypothetical protein SOVF_031180 [Spinacia oleracea]